MKHVGLVSAIGIMAIGLAGPARAVPPGFTLEFDGNGEGKVTFSGDAHSSRAKPHCADCHFELFDVSRSSQITRPDHKRRESRCRHQYRYRRHNDARSRERNFKRACYLVPIRSMTLPVRPGLMEAATAADTCSSG